MGESSTLIKDRFERALNGDDHAVREVPKADLHAHAMLSLPHGELKRCLQAHLESPPERFGSLQDFFKYLADRYWPLYTSIDRVCDVFDGALAHMVSDGVRRTEISLDVVLPRVIGCTWNEFAGRLALVLKRYEDRILVRPELGFAREVPRAVWYPEARAALETGLFASVDLYGQEDAAPIGQFLDYFDMARAHKLKIKFHSGELPDPKRLLEEILIVNPAAVQHGVAAALDNRCMATIIDRGIQLNVCPSSNVALSVVPSLARHPIDTLVRAGVRITLGSDDLAIFGQTVSAEYVNLYRVGKLTADELEQVRQQGLQLC